MKSASEELEECFNAIPKDGTNIKEEEDDDTGYENIRSDTSVSFEEKVAELTPQIEQAAQVKALPRTPQSEEPKVEPKPAPVPAVVVKPVAELETLLIDVVKTEISAPVASSQQPSYDELEVDASLGGTTQKWEDDSIAPSTVKAEPVSASIASPAPEIPAIQIAISMLKNEPEFADKECSKEKAVEPSGDIKSVDIDYDADGWKLVSTNPKFDEFYAKKRYHLKKMLLGNRLPIEKWRHEIQTSHANVECSYDVNSMYEQMKFIQALKVRITEIITHLNSQFYKWKRFMELMRAEAAALENLKVAQSDAAAWRHLPDFEDYFSDLEELNESAEGVMKNLESGWNTLNRGVTIVLQALGADRGMTRFDHSQQGAIQLSHNPNTSQTMARAAMQAFDDREDMTTPSKIPVDDPWSRVKK